MPDLDALSEQRFRLIVEGVKDYAIFMLDFRGIIISWNHGAQRIKGYRWEEIIGKHFSIFYSSEDRQLGKPEQALQTAQRFGHWEDEGWRIRKDGTAFWADVLITALYNDEGELYGYAKITRDISERKRNELAIRESELRFRSLVESSNHAILVADSQGRILSWNRAAQLMFGLEPDSTGQPLTILMPERFREPHRNGLARFKKTGESAVIGNTIELVGLRKDGSEFPLELSVASWESGGSKYFAGTIQDITERKRVEKEIQTLGENLQKRALELELANKELEAFSYSVSHDLRSPLRAIDGFSRLLLQKASDRLDPEAQRLLNIIRTNTQRMGTLIDDLLAFSRLGRQEVHYSEIDMEDLISEVFANLKALNPNSPVQFIQGSLAPARGDRAMIRQVVENLLTNALKFTAGKSPATIEVQCRTDGKLNTYSVKDNGIGFDMKYSNKLFKVFQRLHSAEDFEGTGVGLALVQRIVLRHGGTVWADAKNNGGAIFFFTLPKTITE